MLVDIIGKNIIITEAMKNITAEKLQKLNKYIILGDSTKARVLARTYKNGQKIEITVWSKVGILRSEVTANDYYEALDLAMDKLTDQIRKQKTRLVDKKRQHISKALLEEARNEEEQQEVAIRTKSVEIEEMSIDDAILQMELLGHAFFAFTDEDSGLPAIVYSRKNGGYGLLELERN